MRTIKALKIIGKFSLLLEEMKEKFNEETAEKYVGKFTRLHKDLQRFNRRNKDARYKPAFEHAENATGKMVDFLQGEGDPEVFAEAKSNLEKAVQLMPGGDRR
jgi:hypothetical protein